MVKKSEELTPSGVIPRESDNPIVEEFKEDLLKKPAYGVHSLALENETRFCKVEDLLKNLDQKIDLLEKRIELLENK